MIVEKENVARDYVSCNFCNKGQLNESKNGLIYPYDIVYTFKREGNGIKASICRQCLIELHRKTNEL